MTEKRRLMVNVYPEEIEEYQAQIDQLTAELAEARADAERLATKFVEYDNCVTCRYCGIELFTVDQCLNHSPGCPMTLHRELEDKYRGEG